MFDITQWEDRSCENCSIVAGCPYSKFSAKPKPISLGEIYAYGEEVPAIRRF